MEYPLYELLISEEDASDLEVNYVALVGAPAIEKNFLAFKEHKQAFATVDEERRIISGPAMLAEVPIFRSAEADLPDHLVVFKASTIYNISQKFFSKGYNQNFNIMHDPAQKTEGVCVFESFIVDKARGISPMKGFEDAPEGSWFISAKINNDEVWQKIKSGEVKGFSVEGLFKYKKSEITHEQGMAQIIEILNRIN